MAKSNLKVGLLSVVNAKLGLNDVKLYLGTTLLYPIRDSISSATVTCSSATYTGSTQVALNIIVKLGTKTLTSGTDYTVTLNNGGTNAGTYTVVVTGINDYEGTASGSFVINKANISPSVSIDNWTYGGTAKNPSVSGNTGGGTVTYTYSSDGSTWSSTKPSNAGTYTIKASIAATTNYNSGTATNTFTINKASCPASVAGKSLTYNRSSLNLVTVTNTQSQTIHYKVGSGSWSTTAPTSTNCGSWTIYWYVDANSNYNGAHSSSSPANVSSSMAKVTPVLSTSPTKTADWTYNGQSHALASGGAMKHSSSDSTAVAGTFTYATGKNAGSYSATWTFTPTDTTNYNTATGNAGTVVVSKATGSTGCSGRTLTYNRSAQNLVSVSGNTGTNHYRVGTSGSWSTTIPTATNAGSYDVYVYTDESTNYNAVSTSSSPSKYTTTIAQVTPVLSTAPTNTTPTFNNSDQNLLTGGAMKHSSSDSTAVAGTFTYGKGKNAGTYNTPSWSFTPTDTTNYKSTSGTVSTSTTISKATMSVTEVNYNAAYDGSSHSSTVKVNSAGWDGKTIVYGSSTSYGNTATSSGVTGTAYAVKTATNYTVSTTVYYKVTGGTNFNDYADSVTFQISKKSTNAPVLTAGGTTTYTGTTYYATAKNGSNNPAGTIYYGSSSGSTTYSLTASSTAANMTSMGRANVGTTTIYAFFRPTDTTNYSDSAGATTTVTISNKATGSAGTAVTPAEQTYKSSGTYTYKLSVTGATGTVTYGTGITVQKVSDYSYVTGWTCTSAGVVTVPAGTNAGQYDVTSTLAVAASTNYNEVASVNKTWRIVINRANQYAPTATGATVKYHNTAYAGATGGGGHGQIEWSNGGNLSTVGYKSTKARWSGDTNYNPSEWSNSVNLVVNKAIDASVAMKYYTNKTYTGESQIIAQVNTYHGCTPYIGLGTQTTAPSSWTTALSLYATNAGTYYVWVKGTGDNNHEDLAARYDNSVTINKKDPTITAPTAKSGLTYNGSSQTLWEGGSSTTSGTFTVSNATRTEVGTQTVSWTFTPTDTTNYKTKSGSFTGTISTNFKPSGSDALITSDSKTFCSKP